MRVIRRRGCARRHQQVSNGPERAPDPGRISPFPAQRAPLSPFGLVSISFPSLCPNSPPPFRFPHFSPALPSTFNPPSHKNAPLSPPPPPLLLQTFRYFLFLRIVVVYSQTPQVSTKCSYDLQHPSP